MTQKHTLVLHISPDLEALIMASLITTFEEVRDVLGVVDSPAMKFIPAGPLRKEDWNGEETLTASALTEKGYLFLDCGGGEYDQHGKPENVFRNSVASIDLLAEGVGLHRLLPHLMPLVALVSGNDLSGKDIAPKQPMKNTATPHTPRQLRNLILGWNVLHKDHPEKVAALAKTAFGCILRLIDSLAEEKNADHRELFLYDRMLEGAAAHFRTIRGLDAPDGEIAAVVEAFRKECEAAFVALEREWQTAVADYWKRTSLRKIRVARLTDDGLVHDELTLAVGRSSSTRFGAVTRLGNTGYVDRSRGVDKRPHPGRDNRAKADVTIQIVDDGTFIIATRGIEPNRSISLERVAKAIRETDLRRRAVNLTKDDVRLLGRTGHLRFTDAFGRDQEALFLAEYRTAFGNGFRANPFAPKTPLKVEEIVELTIKALASVE